MIWIAVVVAAFAAGIVLGFLIGGSVATIGFVRNPEKYADAIEDLRRR